MPQYTKKSLEKLYNTNEKRVKKGEKLSLFELSLSSIAGYALDLIEEAESVKMTLDLTYDTIDNVSNAIIACGVKALSFGENETDVLTDLLKKTASYHTLLLCNMLDELYECELELPFYSKEIVLKATNTQDNVTVRYNVFDAHRRANEKEQRIIIHPSGAVEVQDLLLFDIIKDELYFKLDHELRELAKNV